MTAIFVIWIIFESFIRGITVIIYSSGKLHGLALLSFIEAGLNIFLTLSFIDSLGMIGVALATVLSRLISILYIPIIINKTLKINNFKYLLGLISGPISYSIPMIVIISIMNSYVDNAHPSIIQATLITCVALLLNIISFEGVFLIKQRGVEWKDRMKLLKTHYYSI